jgi:hypothetical protein
MQEAWRTGRILFSKRSTSSWARRRRLAARVSITQYTVYRISYTCGFPVVVTKQTVFLVTEVLEAANWLPERGVDIILP